MTMGVPVSFESCPVSPVPAGALWVLYHISAGGRSLCFKQLNPPTVTQQTDVLTRGFQKHSLGFVQDGLFLWGGGQRTFSLQATSSQIASALGDFTSMEE